MSSKGKAVAVIILVSLATLFLLMIPSPRNWGVFGRQFSSVYDDVSHIIQPAVHFVLTALLGAALLFLHDRHHSFLGAALQTVLTVMLIAGTMELMQNFLPAEFARNGDPGDLLPSLGGAVAGVLVAGLYSHCTEKRQHGSRCE